MSFFSRRPSQESITKATHLAERGTDLYLDYIRQPAAYKIPQLLEAIRCLTSALEVLSETEFPREWALTQNNLGGCYRNLPTANKRDNVTKAIEHYNAALRAYKALGLRDRWASTQYNLGNAYRDLPTDDRAERDRKAIQCYKSALEVRTEQAYPLEWARTLQALGAVYAGWSTGDPKGALQQNLWVKMPSGLGRQCLCVQLPWQDFRRLGLGVL